MILNDSTRNVNHNGEPYYCDQDVSDDISPDWQGGNNWYRMMPPAGVVIPETKQYILHCGNIFPAWIRGSHPTDEGEQVELELCFSNHDGGQGNVCAWHHNILVTNCGSYYVYYLSQTVYSTSRHCGADSL